MKDLLVTLAQAMGDHAKIKGKISELNIELMALDRVIEDCKERITEGIGSDPIVFTIPNGTKTYAIYNDRSAGPTISPIEIHKL